MTEAQKFIQTYSAVIAAKDVYQHTQPVLDKLFEYKESGESFTATQIGEAIMGAEKYHETHKERDYRGYYTVRSHEAMSLSSIIGSAIGKMCDRGMLLRKVERDMEHPHTFEGEEEVYTLDGKVLPEFITVTLPSGETVQIHAAYVKGVKREYVKTMVTRYPKKNVYTFK